MFLGWYDPDKTITPAEKVAEAIDRYREKFGRDPELCITSAVDAQALEGAGFDALPVQAKTFISRHTYYVGIEDAAEAVA